MRSTSEILEKLVIHCATRGAAAQLARDLNVAKSTVTRWLEEKTIPDTMQKLLAWYLFGEAPPSIIQKYSVQDALEFDEVEWRIIANLARREGVTEAQWITGRIRAYLAYRSEQSDVPQSETPRQAKQK